MLTASHKFWDIVFIIPFKTFQIPYGISSSTREIFDFQINSVVVEEYILNDLIPEKFKICFIASRWDVLLNRQCTLEKYIYPAVPNHRVIHYYFPLNCLLKN